MQSGTSRDAEDLVLEDVGESLGPIGDRLSWRFASVVWRFACRDTVAVEWELHLHDGRAW